MTKFSHVIIRRPGKSLCNGITSAPELGQPIYERAIEEHYDYEHALEQCGVDVYRAAGTRAVSRQLLRRGSGRHHSLRRHHHQPRR